MSTFRSPEMIEQAIAWHLRLAHADDNAWIEFADWLEADPAHNRVYESVVDGDAQMSAALQIATFPNMGEAPQFSDDEKSPPVYGEVLIAGKRSWRWAAMAASVAVAGLLTLQMLPSQSASYVIETSPGETRNVALADGSEIFLNGDTRIVLDRNDPRSVEIARGEARFDVQHDDSDPFTVVAGDQRLTDIGTVFNVVRTDRQLRVGVVEGAVRFEGGARSVELRAGDSLAADVGGSVLVGQSPVAAIGSWANGVLVFDQAPLDQVAADLSRSIGIVLDLPPDMRSGSFSGVIQTDGDRELVRGRLEELIGARITANGTRWSVEAP